MRSFFSVKDEGIGIEQEDFSKIFAQFSRSTQLHKSKSFGIGLFIVKSVVDAHNGESCT